MFERKKTGVVKYLVKLRPDFEPIWANIFNTETLPYIDVVFEKLIYEERHINTLASMIFFYTIDMFVYTLMLLINNILKAHFKSLYHNALSAKSDHILSYW